MARQCSAASTARQPTTRSGERDALPSRYYLSFNAGMRPERKSTMVAESIDGPLVEFFQMVPNRRPPRRADRAVGGVIPARALRYWDAITSASSFAFCLLLTINFRIAWVW